MNDSNLISINKFLFATLYTVENLKKIYASLEKSGIVSSDRNEGALFGNWSPEALRQHIKHFNEKSDDDKHKKILRAISGEKPSLLITKNHLLILKVLSELELDYDKLMEKLSTENIDALTHDNEYVEALSHEGLNELLVEIKASIDNLRKKTTTLEETILFLHTYATLFSQYGQLSSDNIPVLFLRQLEEFARKIKDFLPKNSLEKKRLRDMVPKSVAEKKLYLILYVNYALLATITDCIRRFSALAFGNVEKHAKKDAADAQNKRYAKALRQIMGNKERQEYKDALAVFSWLKQKYYQLISDFIERLNLNKPIMEDLKNNNSSLVNAFEYEFIGRNLHVFNRLVCSVKAIVQAHSVVVQMEKNIAQPYYFAYLSMTNEQAKALRDDGMEIEKKIDEMSGAPLDNLLNRLATPDREEIKLKPHQENAVKRSNNTW